MIQIDPEIQDALNLFAKIKGKRQSIRLRKTKIRRLFK